MIYIDTQTDRQICICLIVTVSLPVEAGLAQPINPDKKIHFWQQTESCETCELDSLLTLVSNWFGPSGVSELISRDD